MDFDFQLRTNKLLTRLRYLGSWFTNNSYDSYFAYAVFVSMYHNLHNIAQAIYTIYHYDDLDEWSSSGLLTLTTSLTNFKTYCVLTNKERILKINKMVTKASFQPKNHRQKKMATGTFKAFDTIYTMHMMGPTATILFFSLYALVESKTGRKLPFNAWYPYDFKKSPYFEITYFFQFTATMVQAQIYINSDGLAYNLIAILVTQLRFLADNLRNMCKDKQFLEKDEMDVALFHCIKHHKEILVCYNEVYHMLNINLFGQYILSTTTLCLTLIQMTVVNPTSTHFIALIVYGMALLIQLLMFCWWGNELIINSRLIPQAAFESRWVDGSVTFRKNLLFFIMRTQREMALFAIDYFKVSLNSFIVIIKNSYSFYCVLSRTNKTKLT